MYNREVEKLQDFFEVSNQKLKELAETGHEIGKETDIEKVPILIKACIDKADNIKEYSILMMSALKIYNKRMVMRAVTEGMLEKLEELNPDKSQKDERKD